MTQQQASRGRSEPCETGSDLHTKQMWHLRWVLLVGLFTLFIGSLLLVAYIRDPLFLGLPSSLLLAMRPMIRYAFGQPDKNKKEESG